jgi:adenosylcobinamide kinase/adenosylcobinamide-phosphate guanylyltransferase
VSIILVLGGARSGKSIYAQQRATELGRRVLYVATAEALDDEMAARIDEHRRSRPSSWKTIEAARDVTGAIAGEVGDVDVVIVDCLTLLLANIGDEHSGIEVWRERAEAELDTLAALAERSSAHFILVANEVGLGLVPTHALGRSFRDVAGRANQMLARRAAEVYFLIAGIPVALKIEDTAG